MRKKRRPPRAARRKRGTMTAAAIQARDFFALWFLEGAIAAVEVGSAERRVFSVLEASADMVLGSVLVGSEAEVERVTAWEMGRIASTEVVEAE
jgi:hypothetical protein